MSVVPPPMSTSATPELLLVVGQHRLAGGELLDDGFGDGHAGAVHARDDVLRRALAAGDDVDVDLEPGAGHADRRADAVLLVDDEVLRQHVQNLAAGRQRHRLGGVDRAAHVLAGDLAVLAGHRDHAAAVEPLDVRAGQRQVHRVDLDAGHQLGFFDRLLDRVDRRLEVDDDAAADAARLGDAEADDVEPVAVEHLADDRRHLRRADVEADQIPLFSRHSTSGPSRQRRFAFARLSRAASRCRRRDRRRLRRPCRSAARRCDRRTAGRRSRCRPRARAASAPARGTTASRGRNWSSPRWITAGSPLRITDGVVQVGDVDLRQPPRDVRLRLAARRSRAPPARRARSSVSRAVAGRGRQAVDDRQVELGVLRPVLVDHHAALVDQIQLAVRCGRCRSAGARTTTTSTVDGSERRSAASRTQGDASSRCRQASRSVHTRFSPRRPLSTASTSPSTAARCRDDDAIDLQDAAPARRTAPPR